MKAVKLFSVFILLLLTLPFAFAESEFEDPEIFGLEVEKLIAFFGAHVAAALALLTYVAYNRTKRSKLLFIILAFAIFSLKLFLISSELFIDELPWIDIVTSFLDFAILLSFFFGVVKK